MLFEMAVFNHQYLGNYLIYAYLTVIISKMQLFTIEHYRLVDVGLDYSVKGLLVLEIASEFEVTNRSRN